MSNITDLPQPFRPYMRVLNKGSQKIIDTIADTTKTIPEKIEKIERIYGLMGRSVTESVKLLHVGTENLEADVDAELLT
jgi:hypothetical protein